LVSLFDKKWRETIKGKIKASEKEGFVGHHFKCPNAVEVSLKSFGLF